MSLPKKDIRSALQPEIHQALRVLATLAGETLDRYIERIVSRHVVREAKAAIVRADEFQRCGIDRKFRESQFDDGVES